MRWAHFENTELSDRVLYWALMGALSPYSKLPVDYALRDILSGGRSLGGDPGWSMEYEK